MDKNTQYNRFFQLYAQHSAGGLPHQAPKLHTGSPAGLTAVTANAALQGGQGRRAPDGGSNVNEAGVPWLSLLQDLPPNNSHTPSLPCPQCHGSEGRPAGRHHKDSSPPSHSGRAKGRPGLSQSSEDRLRCTLFYFWEGPRPRGLDVHTERGGRTSPLLLRPHRRVSSYPPRQFQEQSSRCWL